MTPEIQLPRKGYPQKCYRTGKACERTVKLPQRDDRPDAEISVLALLSHPDRRILTALPSPNYDNTRRRKRQIFVGFLNKILHGNPNPDSMSCNRCHDAVLEGIEIMKQNSPQTSKLESILQNLFPNR